MDKFDLIETADTVTETVAMKLHLLGIRAVSIVLQDKNPWNKLYYIKRDAIRSFYSKILVIGEFYFKNVLQYKGFIERIYCLWLT